VIVGSDAGGGYDAYARLVADYMPAHIPGNPTFVVQNMPGAGSLIAMNYVANIASKDGTVLAAIHADTVIAPLFHPEQARFDSPGSNWIGSPVTTTYAVAMWHTAPVQKYEQVFEHEAIVSAAGGDSISLPLLTNALLGTKFKIVQGYKSAAEALLAIQKGEAQGTAGDGLSFLKLVGGQYLKSGDLRIIASYALRRVADLPDVPLVIDFAKTPEQKEALGLTLSEQDFGWPFLMAKGVAAERAQIMRDAFDATMNDPAFLAEAKKRKLEIEPISGAAQARAVAAAFRTPEQLVEKVKKIVGQ
jgi:tripartite-type tricarboxylate transporter receptor subunit TctC